MFGLLGEMTQCVVHFPANHVAFSLAYAINDYSHLWL